MTKRLRLILILAFVAVAVWFLAPSVRWYLVLTGDQRREANASREQIRVLARQRADADLSRLIDLARNDPGDPVPDDLGYLIRAARERLRVERRDVPRNWDVATVAKVFPSEGETFVAMEDHHRADLLALKDLRSRSIQLGARPERRHVRGDRARPAKPQRADRRNPERRGGGSRAAPGAGGAQQPY